MKKLLAVLVVGLLLGADGDKDAGKKGGDALKGTWKIVSAERDGKPQEKPVGDKVTFEGATLTIQGKEQDHKGTYKVDAGKKPKQIDITPGDGPQKDQVMEGIYSVEKDELKICIAKPGSARPTDFMTKEGSESHLIILKRDK